MKLRWAVAFAAAAALGALPAGAGSAPTPAPTPIDGKIAYTSTWDGQADIYSLDAKNVPTCSRCVLPPATTSPSSASSRRAAPN